MLPIFMAVFVLCSAGFTNADTVTVVVGDAGCVGRENTLKTLWAKIAGVTSVSVLPRQPKNPGGQRTFVVLSSGIPPTKEALRIALGRRDKNFPILDYQPVKAEKSSAGQ